MMYWALILFNPGMIALCDRYNFDVTNEKTEAFGEFGYLQVEKQGFQAIVNKCKSPGSTGQSSRIENANIFGDDQGSSYIIICLNIILTGREDHGHNICVFFFNRRTIK